MTPIQAGNSDSQKQLQKWLEEADISALNAEEKRAIGQLLAELQDIPSAPVSPRLEGRLQSLSQWQPAPSSHIKRFLAFLSAGLAAAGAVLVWESSRLKLQLAQKEPNPAISTAIRLSETDPRPSKETMGRKVFLLTSSQNPDAEVKVIIQPGKASNLLAGQGLPQLATGQTYRLWAETPLGLQGCMAFKPDAEGRASIQIPSEPSGSAISLLISIDPIYAGTSVKQPRNPFLTSI